MYEAKRTIEANDEQEQERLIMYDVIIPVYNDINTIECIQRCLKYTDFAYRLVVVNDESSNKEVLNFLDTLRNIENIVLIDNEVNLGFTASVNKGMSYSDNDVVLLNTDAFVTRGWLSKMHQCAYSDERIMTVTPLSNNATICSVPDFNKDNEIPEGFDIDSFAEFIDAVSLKKYTRLPTGIGFCMLIKRAALNFFGLFDVELFGKGYGEENDFCLKLGEAGYYNVVDDATFVYHKGQCSFKETTNTRLKENLAVLGKKYPYYFSMVQKFVKNNPMKAIHENISLRIKTYSSRKKKILYLVHNPIDSGLVGGTEFHVKDLVDNIQDKIFYILFVKDTNFYLDEFNQNEKCSYVFPISWKLDAKDFYNREYREILKGIIVAFNIDLIHCQHLMRHTLDVFPVSEEFGVPLMLTVHDYYAVCSFPNLLDVENIYCGVSTDAERCEMCVKGRLGYGSNFVNAWRENFAACLKMVAKIIAPDQSVFDHLLKIYEIPEGRMHVIPHGIDIAKDSVRHCERDFAKPLRVAFLGYLARHKGFEVIKKLVERCKIDNIEWHFIGADQGLRSQIKQDNTFFHGLYKRQHIQKILADLTIDIVMILSVWPETFCYTLSEAWSAGVPCLVSDLGAMGERMRREKGGWVVGANNVEEIISTVEHLIKNPAEYEMVKKQVEKMKFKTSGENAGEYDLIYNVMIDNADKTTQGEVSMRQLLDENKALKNTLIKMGVEYGSFICMLKEKDAKIECGKADIAQKDAELEQRNRILKKKDNELNAMRNSLSWRITASLRKIGGLFAVK